MESHALRHMPPHKTLTNTPKLPINAPYPPPSQSALEVLPLPPPYSPLCYTGVCMSSRSTQKKRLFTLAVCCASFLGFGLFTASLGPNLDEIARLTGNSLAAMGSIFTAMYFAAILAQVVYGPLDDRFGERPLMLIGLCVSSIGTFGITISHYLPFTLASAFLLGLGGGTIITSANVLVSESYPDNRVSALNVLNLFFGVGAIAGPALAGLLLRAEGTALPVLWGGAAVFLLLVPLVALMPVPTHADRGRNTEGTKTTSVYGSLLLWVIGTLLLVYVGTEVGVGGWTPAYMKQTTGLDADTAALVASGFWLGFTLGRIIAAIVGTRLTAITLLLAATGGALLSGLLLVVSSGNLTISILATLLLGFCFGPIYPTGLAITTTAFAYAPGRAVSVVAAMGSAGGMLLPALQGILLEDVSPVASVTQVALATLAMLGLALVVRALLLNRAKLKTSSE